MYFKSLELKRNYLIKIKHASKYDSYLSFAATGSLNAGYLKEISVWKKKSKNESKTTSF